MVDLTFARTDSRLTLRVGAVGATRLVVSMSAVAFAAYWIAVAWTRWRNLQVGAFDFAFFDQIIWNTSQGRLFETTFSPYNFVGQHFEPVLLLFSLAYRAGAGPLSLLVVQAVVVGMASLTLLEAGRALRLPSAVAAAGAIAYLGNPFLHRALAFDFHPETVAALPAFAAVWAFATGRHRLGSACALGVLLLKEDMVFIVLALALVAWVLGARRSAAVLAASGLVWAVVVVLLVMPLVRGGQPSDLVDRYAWIVGGHSGLVAVAWIATHPQALAAPLLEPARFEAAGAFLVGSGPWLLLAPAHALTLIPGLGLALLSSHGAQQALAFHYAAGLVPVASIAGLFGARRLRSVPPQVVAALMLGNTLIALPLLGPPFPLDGGGAPTAAHRLAAERVAALIPADDAVSAQSNLAPRLAHRRELWEFPGQWRRAEWVVIDRYGFRSQQSLDAGFERELALVRSAGKLLFDEDGVAVYRIEPQ